MMLRCAAGLIVSKPFVGGSRETSCQGDGKYAEATEIAERSLALAERRYGRDHPDVAPSLNNLASLYRLVSEGRSTEPGLVREMFQMAQWAQGSEIAASLAQMAARGAKGDPALAALVRERQDLVGEWQKRDGARNTAVSQVPGKRDRATEAVNVARLDAIDARIGEIDKRLLADFPDYAALARPEPLSIESVQAQLGTDEAVVLFLDTPSLPLAELSKSGAIRRVCDQAPQISPRLPRARPSRCRAPRL